MKEYIKLGFGLIFLIALVIGMFIIQMYSNAFQKDQVFSVPVLNIQPYIHVESYIEGTYYVGVRVNGIIEDQIVTNREGTNYINIMLNNATNVLRENYPNHRIVVKEIDCD